MTINNLQKDFWESEKQIKRRRPFHPVIRAFVLPKIKFIQENISLTKDTSLLDVGCGNGFFTYYFRQICQVTGLDFSRQMLAMNPHDTDKLILGEAENLPFPNDSFDIVFCSNLLHHLQNPAKALAEMKRTAKTYIIVSEPNRNNPFLFIFNLLKKEERKALKFNKKYLIKLGEKIGLKKINVLISGLIFPNKTPVFLLPLLNNFNFPQPWGGYITIIFKK